MRSLLTFSTSSLALAVLVAGGMTALPFASGHDGSAAAQSVNASRGADEHGEALEFVEDADERVGGIGELGISSGEQRYADPSSVNVSPDLQFERYVRAAEENDLEEAGLALDQAADRPITESYVAEVNRQLGVRTSLTAEQIAEAANDEPLPY